MRTLKTHSILRFILILALSCIVVISCTKDDDGDNNQNPAPVNPLAGTYTFIAATFNNPVTVIVNVDTNNYQTGDDANLFVGAGLLGAAPCDNPENAALELRANFTSFYVCQGEANEAQQGTWSTNDDYTLLDLIISNPADFRVPITSLDLTDNKLSGTILFLPLPFDTSIPVGDTLANGGINFQTANVDVEFSKIK